MTKSAIIDDILRDSLAIIPTDAIVFRLGLDQEITDAKREMLDELHWMLRSMQHSYRRKVIRLGEDDALTPDRLRVLAVINDLLRALGGA